MFGQAGFGVRGVVVLSGGGCEGDLVAERLELVDEVAGLAVVVEAFVVEVRTEIMEPGGGIR